MRAKGGGQTGWIAPGIEEGGGGGGGNTFGIDGGNISPELVKHLRAQQPLLASGLRLTAFDRRSVPPCGGYSLLTRLPPPSSSHFLPVPPSLPPSQTKQTQAWRQPYDRLCVERRHVVSGRERLERTHRPTDAHTDQRTRERLERTHRPTGVCTCAWRDQRQHRHWCVRVLGARTPGGGGGVACTHPGSNPAIGGCRAGSRNAQT